MENKGRRQYILILLITLIAYLGVQYAFYQSVYLSQGTEIMGTDTFMRLVRVENLYETGNWFDGMSERSNAPFGELLHWTRPFDMVLLMPTILLSAFMPFSTALKIMGIVVSPLLGCLSLFLVIWMLSPLVESEKRPLLLLLFLSQPMIYQFFSFGRPDHHGLLLVVFIMNLGLLIRLIKNPKRLREQIILGILLAFSIYISVEAIVVVLLIFGILCTLWLLYEGDFLRASTKVAGVLTTSTAVFMMIEKPLGGLAEEIYDQISLVYIVFFMIITIILLSSSYVYRRTAKTPKILVLGTFALVGAGIMYGIYPNFFKGPFVLVNPRLFPIWLEHVNEVQPMLSQGLKSIGSFMIIMGLPLTGLTYYLLNFKKKSVKEKQLSVAVGLSFLVYGFLSLYQIRWSGYLFIVSLYPIFYMIGSVMDKVNVIVNKQKWRSVYRVSSLMVILFGFLLIGSIFLMVDKDSKGSDDLKVDIAELCKWINQNDELADSTQTLLTFIDYGPEILYRTSHQVIATPYHRNDLGILFAYDVMNATDEKVVREQLDARAVTLIVVSSALVEKNYYGENESGATFYEQLVSGNPKIRLIEMKLPKEIKYFRVYRYQ